MEGQTYILRVNKLCPSCSMRNIIEHTSNEPIEIVACSNCGEFLMIPPNFTKYEAKVVGNIINKVIKEGPDALL